MLDYSLKISVVTPNYNYSQYIGKLLESVVSQNYDNIEHIVVDDGSIDNSVEIIKEYIQKYPQIFNLIQQENKGQTSAINLGLQHATGDIIGWINSDDTYCENVFSQIVQTFNSNKLVDVVFGDICIIDRNGNFIKNIKYLPFDYYSGVFNGFGKIISSNAIFWKKERMEKIGFLDENFVYAMDSEYWSRLLFKTQVKHIDLFIANFRWHDNAKTRKRISKENNAFKDAKSEDKLIFNNSFIKLEISNGVPSKFIKMYAIYYKLKRHFYKLIYGHYFS